MSRSAYRGRYTKNAPPVPFDPLHQQRLKEARIRVREECEKSIARSEQSRKAKQPKYPEIEAVGGTIVILAADGRPVAMYKCSVCGEQMWYMPPKVVADPRCKKHPPTTQPNILSKSLSKPLTKKLGKNGKRTKVHTDGSVRQLRATIATKARRKLSATTQQRRATSKTASGDRNPSEHGTNNGTGSGQRSKGRSHGIVTNALRAHVGSVPTRRQPNVR